MYGHLEKAIELSILKQTLKIGFTSGQERTITMRLFETGWQHLCLEHCAAQTPYTFSCTFRQIVRKPAASKRSKVHDVVGVKHGETRGRQRTKSMPGFCPRAAFTSHQNVRPGYWLPSSWHVLTQGGLDSDSGLYNTTWWGDASTEKRPFFTIDSVRMADGLAAPHSQQPRMTNSWESNYQVLANMTVQ